MAEVCVALWGVAGARGWVLSPPAAREMSDVWELFRRLARCEIPSSSRAPHGGPVDVSFTRTLSRLAPALSREIQIIARISKPVWSVLNLGKGWYGDFDIAEPAPNDYGTVK